VDSSIARLGLGRDYSNPHLLRMHKSPPVESGNNTDRSLSATLLSPVKDSAFKNRAFLRIHSTEGRDVRLRWALSNPQGPKGQGKAAAYSCCFWNRFFIYKAASWQLCLTRFGLFSSCQSSRSAVQSCQLWVRETTPSSSKRNSTLKRTRASRLTKLGRSNRLG
jgi:hypothetical protein